MKGLRKEMLKGTRVMKEDDTHILVADKDMFILYKKAGQEVELSVFFDFTAQTKKEVRKEARDYWQYKEDVEMLCDLLEYKEPKHAKQ